MTHRDKRCVLHIGRREIHLRQFTGRYAPATAVRIGHKIGEHHRLFTHRIAHGKKAFVFLVEQEQVLFRTEKQVIRIQRYHPVNSPVRDSRHPEHFESMSVVTVQSATGSEPHEAFRIFCHGMNVVVRQSVVHVQYLKILLGKCLCTRRKKRGNTKERYNEQAEFIFHFSD